MHETLSSVVDPYVAAEMTAAQLGIPPEVWPADAKIPVKRFEQPLHSLEEAAKTYELYGAAIIAGDTPIPFRGREVTLEDVVSPVQHTVIKKLEEEWGSLREKDIVKLKDIHQSYNGTGRHMKTIEWENVKKHFPEVIDLQHDLLEMVKQVNGDPETLLSVDEDEGTVINLQTYPLDSNPDTIQQHGAHTDRVDTTLVMCLENIGEHGELVFVEGFTAACQSLGLDPHQDFNGNLYKVLLEALDKIEFRVHPVEPDNIVVVRTDRDVHFISQKTFGDVAAGLEASHKSGIIFGGVELFGRGIANMAYETAECRSLDALSKQFEAEFDLMAYYDSGSETFLKMLDLGLGQKSEFTAEQQESIRKASVARYSAYILYVQKQLANK